MSGNHGSLVLVPVSLGETPWQGFLPEQAQQRVASIRHFVVETEKVARQQLKRLDHPLPLRELDIRALPDNASREVLSALLAPIEQGKDLGLMSDAGCPAIADPGARLVSLAQELNIRVEPLVGPSSILLALIGSGLNGQSFSFCGYLPVADDQRDARIKQLEQESKKLARTQIFIETPYRNERLFDALTRQCRDTTRLCVARDLTTRGEYIRTQTIAQWRQCERPDLDRRPAIFLILGM